jgi:hypothetical protein
MLKNIKEIFKMCKELIVEFFRLVNNSIEDDNLVDAFIMLLLGGILFVACTVFVILIISALINYPCLVFIFVIPFLPCVYIWWMKRLIKKKKDK